MENLDAYVNYPFILDCIFILKIPVENIFEGSNTYSGIPLSLSLSLFFNTHTHTHTHTHALLSQILSGFFFYQNQHFFFFSSLFILS